MSIESWMKMEQRMTSFLSRERYPDVQEELPDGVLNWLAAAWLLYDIPFQYLVPDERYLPMESVRFFWMDVNWLAAMLDGALSIGDGTSTNQVLRRRLAERREREVITRLYEPRRRNMHPNHQRNCTTAGEDLLSQNCMGFLLRSRLVSDYPDMEVTGWNVEKERQLLRLELLSDTTMIGIFDGTVSEVILQEASEGLHFGCRTSQGEIYVRRIAAEGEHEIGDKLSNHLYPVPVREGRMVEVAKLAELFMEKLGVGTDCFTSAEFAMEMLATAEQIRLCRKEET
nr:hypothetical protein [uncultured Oscillibacter sp.]